MFCLLYFWVSFSSRFILPLPGTNRRRIYDIINVMEALEMISKQSKNWYKWLGRANLITTLAKLKVECIVKKLCAVDFLLPSLPPSFPPFPPSLPPVPPSLPSLPPSLPSLPSLPPSLLSLPPPPAWPRGLQQ